MSDVLCHTRGDHNAKLKTGWMVDDAAQSPVTRDMEHGRIVSPNNYVFLSSVLVIYLDFLL